MMCAKQPLYPRPRIFVGKRLFCLPLNFVQLEQFAPSDRAVIPEAAAFFVAPAEWHAAAQFSAHQQQGRMGYAGYAPGKYTPELDAYQRALKSINNMDRYVRSGSPITRWSQLSQLFMTEASLALARP